MRVRAAFVLVQGIPCARLLTVAAASARVDEPLAGEAGAVYAMHYVSRVVVVRKGSTPPFFKDFFGSSQRESVVRVCATDTLLNCAL